MAIAPESTRADPTPPADAPAAASTRTAGGARLLVALVVAAVVSPIVVAALALVGDPWVPLSDWASLVFRVSEVGGTETPLVGPYSFHGFAHPGPLLYWIAAPLYRLTDGDPRSLLWTGAVVNVVTIVAIAGVAWRRGRWPLLLGAMALVTVLVHGIGPGALVDLWNPYIALLPFALTVFLAWDVALGRQRALVEAVLPATFAVQSHLAFLSLVGLVAVWLVAWVRWSPRLLGDDAAGGGATVSDGSVDGDGDAPEDGASGDGAGHGIGTRVALLRSTTVRRIALIAGVLWVGPVLDALVDRHNPLNIARSLGHSEAVAGPVDGAALLGRYIGPVGAWATGSEESLGMTVSRLHILALVGVLAVLAASLRVARRRRFTDAAALVSLVAMLVAGGVVAASQLVSPTPPYLLEWMKVVGAFVWFAVGWTCWCVVEARVVGAPARGRHLAAAAAGIAVLGGIAWSWGDASRNAPPHDERPGLVAEIRAALQSELDDDLTYRVAVVGDPTGHHQGIFYWLIRDGHDVVTSDGSAGLKWGRRHVWERGDHVDSHITIAVHYGNSLSPAFDECSRDSDQDLLFFQSDLGQDDLTWIEDVNLRRLEESDTISPAEEARWDELTDRDFRVAVFEGDENCGRDDAGWDDAEQDDHTRDDDADGS